MNITIELNNQLLQQALQATGFHSSQAVVEAALQALLRSLPETSARQNFDDLAQDPVVGMWADRPEMQDSSAWVRQLRRRQWGKQRS
ncbi:MAG: type II toxin-antitoxin system VapB family antitoxin [Chloroflexi bacterium]|nr:type II toxin-antitoxin system VapB family antitoxin [Chloroflexota bacterium]